ncbi:radical SAM protein [Acidianus ambivalens]|uniref:Radical SAM protein n=1 Tax=Acidianus ambivalens TaxID=2283 RepID=A0A650CVP0_ACIAM|nr:radical SAM protein [Acidianus ambivalens]MQL56534.1 radical SAM protein [Acidianus ambivalens]QGR21941.1 radical SAM protein [Acidianus ambivalens]
MSFTLDFLTAPTYWSWQLTNRCNLECIHCLEMSGPNAAYPDELSPKESMNLCKKIADFGIPYAALSGGEPLLYPGFWDLFSCFRNNGVEVKIESNGNLISESVADRIAKLEPRSVQISIDGATQKTYSTMRPRGVLEKALNAIRYLSERGIYVEVEFVPTKINFKELGDVIDKVVELGAKAVYTGKIMYLGNAVNHWSILSLNDEDYKYIEGIVKNKSTEYKDVKIVFYPVDLVEELRIRLEDPPSSILMMANGKVRLLNSIPYVVADVRKHSMEEIWERYKKGWRHPKVKEWVEEVTKNPKMVAKAFFLEDLF